MKSCCKCGKNLLSGHIICGECKDNESLPLRYYIDQLAEDIVIEYPQASCELCIMRVCEQQQSGLVCRIGVKEFLLGQIKAYTDNFNTCMETFKDHFILLDNISKEKTMTAAVAGLAKQYPDLTEYQLRAIVETWMDIRSISLARGA